MRRLRRSPLGSPTGHACSGSLTAALVLTLAGACSLTLPDALGAALLAATAAAAATLLLRLPRALDAPLLRLLLDGALTAASLVLLLGALVLDGMRGFTSLTTSQQVCVLLAPASVALLLSLAASVVRLGPRAHRAARRSLTAGLSLAVLSALLLQPWLLPLRPGAARTGVTLLIGSAALLLWSRQALRRAGSRPVPQSAPPSRRAAMLLPYVSLSAATTVLALGGLLGRHLTPVEVWVSSAVVVALLVRQVIWAAENGTLTRRLAAREELFRSLVQGSSDVVTVWDAQGVVRFCSPASARVFGSDPEQVVGRSLGELVHPDDIPTVRRALRDVVRSPGSTTTRFECRVRDAAGSWRATESTVSNHLDTASVRGLVFNTRDVSDRDALREQLVHLAYHDALTELPNRALFRDRVGQSLRRRRLGAAPVAVMFLDLDGFKEVNDSAGHSIGDELLRQCASRLSSVLRMADSVARLGGDEFAVLLEDEKPGGGGLEVAQRVLAAMEQPYDIAGRSLVVGASIGLAFATDSCDADVLLRNADLAMYRAKAAGKGRVEVFVPAMHEDLVRRVEAESDLRRALDAGELRLAYQPIVDLGSGEVVEVEALVRWEHPERGLVMPGEFIGVAEDSGLIVPLGRFVLEQACRQLARWHRAGFTSLSMAVNVSARQIQAPGLVDTVAGVLRVHGIPARCLTLEITENVLVDHDERTVAKIELLRELGVRLAIDDFGTGYSSLAYLRSFPVDTLKVDRSFVSGLGERADVTSLTSAIVRLGRELGLTLVAEGIEQQAELLELLGMGCHRGQGYLFSRPVSADGVSELLRSRPDLLAAAPA